MFNYCTIKKRGRPSKYFFRNS
ncbi:hypothetical protein EIG78_12425 [Avibacterium paragallinarum]|nr:hypothetical protein EIG78_12425 [Avibacterium paragallinarum]